MRRRCACSVKNLTQALSVNESTLLEFNIYLGYSVMNKLHGVSILCLALTAQSAMASEFFDKQKLIGCGTIVSVRNVDQAPLFDNEYVAQNKDGIRTYGIASLMAGAGLIKYAAAAIGTVVADEALANTPSKVKEQDKWSNVKAVRIQMDGGQEINLPLIKPRDDIERRQYTEGKRVTVYHVPQYNSIQLDTMIRLPDPGDEAKAKSYAFHCTRRLDDVTAEAVLKDVARLIQEDKIIQ